MYGYGCATTQKSLGPWGATRQSTGGRFTLSRAEIWDPPLSILARICSTLELTFRGRRQVDEALARLGDISLSAEVRRYRASQEVIKELEAAIKRLEDDIFVHVDSARHSAKRLGRAHAILRVRDEHETDVGLTAVPNWVVERGRSPL
ncbi:hypothetical protein EI94DRAFT_1703532 [Lactarius quietus]|nr:hypothetical protein EI94DRAFT_1703532 [Lactarius quietus]